VHLKEVSIECEERLRVKDKVNQIVKIFNRSGVLSEHISFKKIPRPKACKFILMVFMPYMSLILKKNIAPSSSNYILTLSAQRVEYIITFYNGIHIQDLYSFSMS
jgi:hypothetical protein